MVIRVRIERAKPNELSDVLALQYLCYQSEAELYQDFTIPPLTQSLQELQNEAHLGVCLVMKQNGIVGSVRATLEHNICKIGKLIVHPDYQGRGHAKQLMAAIENEFCTADSYEVFTGHLSVKNLALYEKLGYRRSAEKMLRDKVTLVYLLKIAKRHKE